jgi:hypothetical protein
MQNNEQKAGTAAEKRTAADSIPSASLVQNGLLSAALSVEEGNKLIAEFMDRNKAFDPRDKIYQYHSSWDWLMPVVEKIEAMRGTHLLMKPFGCEILMFGKSLINEVGNTKIEAAWLAVVEFIKWYNQSK